MSQQQIKGATGALGSGGSLDVYDVPGSVLVTPYAVSATFDGSGAGGSFLPCLTFKTQTGAIIARCPAPEVASGDTAEVSWFPHVAQSAGGTPSTTGIFYDINNLGDWLSVETNGPENKGIFFDVVDDGGFTVGDHGSGGISMRSNGTGGISFVDDDIGITFNANNQGGLNLTTAPSGTGDNGISITEGSAGDGGIFIDDSGTGGVTIRATQASSFILLQALAGGAIKLQGLPTVNPGGSHIVWNNGGVLNIT